MYFSTVKDSIKKKDENTFSITVSDKNILMDKTLKPCVYKRIYL